MSLFDSLWRMKIQKLRNLDIKHWDISFKEQKFMNAHITRDA